MTELRIVPFEETVRQDTVATLERLLQEAKDGLVVEFVAVAIRKDDSFETVVPACLDRTKLIGYLFQLLFDRAKN